MVSIIYDKRALPIYWQILSKAGSSNLREQKTLLRPVLRGFKGYKIILIADREFKSVKLANWLEHKRVYLVLRQKQGTYIQEQCQEFQRLNTLGLAPGVSLYLPQVQVTKQAGCGKFALAAYWQRTYQGKAAVDGWYLLTNLGSVEAAVSAYSARFGIERRQESSASGQCLKIVRVEATT